MVRLRQNLHRAVSHARHEGPGLTSCTWLGLQDLARCQRRWLVSRDSAGPNGRRSTHRFFPSVRQGDAKVSPRDSQTSVAQSSIVTRRTRSRRFGPRTSAWDPACQRHQTSCLKAAALCAGHPWGSNPRAASRDAYHCVQHRRGSHWAALPITLQRAIGHSTFGAIRLRPEERPESGHVSYSPGLR